MTNFKQYYSKVIGELTSIKKEALRSAILARSNAELEITEKRKTQIVETENLGNDLDDESLTQSLNQMRVVREAFWVHQQRRRQQMLLRRSKAHLL